MSRNPDRRSSSFVRTSLQNLDLSEAPKPIMPTKSPHPVYTVSDSDDENIVEKNVYLKKDPQNAKPAAALPKEKLQRAKTMINPPVARESLQPLNGFLSTASVDVPVDNEFRRTTRLMEGQEAMDRSRKSRSVTDQNESTGSRPVTPAEPKKVEQKKEANYAALEAMENISYERKEWKKVTIEEQAKDSDDEEIDIHVRENEDKPTQFWLDLTKEMEKRKQEFAFDYIVGTQPNLKPGEFLKNKKGMVLIKWTKFAVPTWTKLKDVNTKRGNSDPVNLMDKRMTTLFNLEEVIRRETADFDADFPHRWLNTVENINEYVTDERSLYENRLAAWEWRMNFEYAKDHKLKTRAGMKDPAPRPIYAINWVDDSPIPGMDPRYPFKFITKNENSQQVADVLANTQEMAWVKCRRKVVDGAGKVTPDTKSYCNPSCTHPTEHYHNMGFCCGLLYGGTAHHYHRGILISREDDPDEVPIEPVGEGEYTSAGILTNHEIEQKVVVECVAACECENCRQRIVQRGRLHSLIIFRERTAAGKGWGLRAGETIAKGEFVIEYVGKMMAASEMKDDNSNYSFGMRCGWSENLKVSGRVRNLPERMKNIIRKHRPFICDAMNMGNESRFINHSCEPNLVATVVFVERHGEFYHRIALFARKDIKFGEELSFDYFPSKNDIDSWHTMFKECKCGAKLCKFKNPVDEEMKENSDDDDDVQSVDSFLSDDEEYRKQSEEVAKKKEELEKKRNGGKPKEREHSPPRVSRAVNMRKDPLEIMRERCGNDEEKFQQQLARRTKNGILQFLMEEPWDQERNARMLEEGRQELLRREKAREDEEKRATDQVKKEGEQEMASGNGGGRKRKNRGFSLPGSSNPGPSNPGPSNPGPSNPGPSK